MPIPWCRFGILDIANAALLTARTEVRSILLTKDKAKRADYIATIDAETKKTESYIESYSKTVLVKEEQEILPKFQSAFERYKKLRGRVIELAMMGKDVEALALTDGKLELRKLTPASTCASSSISTHG